MGGAYAPREQRLARTACTASAPLRESQHPFHPAEHSTSRRPFYFSLFCPAPLPLENLSYGLTLVPGFGIHTRLVKDDQVMWFGRIIRLVLGLLVVGLLCLSLIGRGAACPEACDCETAASDCACFGCVADLSLPADAFVPRAYAPFVMVRPDPGDRRAGANQPGEVR